MENGFDLTYYWKMLKRRYPYMLGAFIVVLAIATVITVWLPPVYRSEARILVESQQIPSDLVRSTVTALADERIQVIKQRITTRDTILDLARKFNLFSEGRKEMSVTQLVDSVRQRIDIRLYDIGTRRGRNNKAFTIAFIVGFEYEKPDIAARVANELVTLILNEDVKTRTSRASETSNFLEREAERLQRALVTVEQQIAQFKAENVGALPSQQQFHLGALQRAEQQQQAIAREINAANDQIRFQEFELSIRAQNPINAAGGAGVPSTGQRLELRLQMLKAQLTEKLVVYSDRHPDVKTLKAQIAAVEKQIADTPMPDPDAEDSPALTPDQLAKMDIQARIVAEKINAIKSRKELLFKQQDAINKQIEETQRLLNRIPEVGNGLAVLERAHETTRKSLTEISDKLADARLGERLESDQQAERLQVIEQPVTPQNPVKPDRQKLLALGFALAVAAAGGAVLGLEVLDSSVKGTSDLLSKANKRPLVVLPYIRTRREQRIRYARIFSFSIVMTILIVAGLAALHFLFMPLDILIPKVIDRLRV